MSSVIIVEDNKELSENFATVLESEGIKVLAKASTGKDGVEAYKKFKPDCVLMDLKMNGPMDGAQAIEEIRKENPNAHIIVTTAHPSYAFEWKTANQVLIKPFEIIDVLEAIKKIN